MEKPALRDYQVADLCFYMQNPKCMVLHDPGCGKTPSVCVYCWYLWDEKKVRTAWAMPKSLLKKNRDELLRFTHFKPEDVIIVDGTPAKREKQMASDAKVFLMGFDCYSSNWKKLLQFHPDVKACHVDEYHMGYSGGESKRTMSWLESMRRMDYGVTMTGTLIDGKFSTAWPAIHAIEPRYYGSYWNFMNTHAAMDDQGNVLYWQNPEKLQKILGRHAIRRSFEAVYGKEAKVIINEPVEMDPKHRGMYDQFHELGLIELEDSFLTGANEGVNLIRARQIMAHPHALGLFPPTHLTMKEQRLLIHFEDCKIKNQPMVIFATLQDEQERIVYLAKREGLRVGLINGNVSAKNRAIVDQEFRAGNLDLVVASPATAGVGFNWDHVDVVIFASLDWKDSSFIQAYRRAIRGVRSKPLMIVILEYEDSIDQKIMGIVERKNVDARRVDETQVEVKLFQKKPDEFKAVGINTSGPITDTYVPPTISMSGFIK